MNNEPQNIMNDLTEKFFENNTIWFSRDEIEELFTIIQVNDTIDSNYLEINLSKLRQNKPALWTMLHDCGKAYAASLITLKSEQSNPYSMVKYIADQKTQLQTIPNDIDTLDKIWESYVWENTYRVWLRGVLSRHYKTEFYIDDYKPMLTVYYN